MSIENNPEIDAIFVPVEALDEYGLPPKRGRRPTIEEVRAIAESMEDPREQVKRLRRRLPTGGRNPFDRKIRSVGRTG